MSSATSTVAPADAGPAAPSLTDPSLDRFDQALRDYQQTLVDDALTFVDGLGNLGPGAPATARRRLYSMPTGTGKGTAQLALLAALRDEVAEPCVACPGKPTPGCANCGGTGEVVYAGLDAWIFTPSLDVMRGYLERCGVSREALDGASEETIARLGAMIYVTTPVRAQNRVLAGERTMPEVVLYDEVHHATEENDVSGTLFALAPLAAFLGFTATPYRGNPKTTAELEAAWPDQVEVLNIPEAVAAGAWALPTFRVVGLVDDDEVKVAGGDFQAKAAGAAVGSRLEDLSRLVSEMFTKDIAARGRVLPTAVTVPNRENAGMLVEALDRRGVFARVIDADTKATARAIAYADAKAGKAVLVSVRVLAEGVDFPWLVRLVDARPTLSPVSWLQQLGRITRPKPDGVRPEYVCVCRNLERHAYLLQGAVPRVALADAQAAFPAPSKRGGSRAIGLEALNKFKAIDLPLADGVRGSMFALYSTDENGRITEWAVLLDPTSERAVTASRNVSPPGPDGKRTWGKWAVTALPNDLTGYSSSGFRGDISDKQRAWWERAATKHGLDVDAVRAGKKLPQRVFAALPVLRDTGLTMRAVDVGAAPDGDA